MSSHLPDQLYDAQGRHITNLRVSVTDRCNFRCVYCMPEEMTWIPKEELLTFEEIVRLLRIAARLGIEKVRLTGGEPTLRADLPDLVRMIRQVPGIRDLGMTTNGLRLAKLARPLYEAGLRRLNISLDTLQRHKFHQLARRDAFEQVMAGIWEAMHIGFHPIKLNAVAMRGYTEDEVLDFAALARQYGFHVRFIEFMPLDAEGIWGPNTFVPGKEIIERIHAVYPLEPLTRNGPEPALRFRFRDGSPGEIGIIASVTQPFCDDCNRVRLTAEGKLRTCLFATTETDLRGPLRNGADDEEIARIFVEAVYRKEPGHLINQEGFVKPERTMSRIGG